MKTIRNTIAGTILFISFGILLMFAEKNYQNAIFETTHSEGTDAAIEEIMYAHGFNIGVFETPTTYQKVKALFK